MQRKQACWNGGGLSLRRDVTAALIRKKMIKWGYEGIFIVKKNAKKP